MMKGRAALFGFLFLILAIFGLYALPLLVKESEIIAPNGAIYTIHIGGWETIPFSITQTSRITGGFTASQPIDFLIMNSTQMNLLIHGGEPPFTGSAASSYGVGDIYQVTHMTSLDLNVTLKAGDYFLVFSSWNGATITVQITSPIIANPIPAQ